MAPILRLILHNQLAYSWLLIVGSVSSLDDNDNAKNNWFNKQNNCSARASRFLVHFFDVNYTTTTRNLLHVMRRFMEDANIRRRIILLLLKAGPKVVPDPGKPASMPKAPEPEPTPEAPAAEQAAETKPTEEAAATDAEQAEKPAEEAAAE